MATKKTAPAKRTTAKKAVSKSAAKTSNLKKLSTKGVVIAGRQVPVSALIAEFVGTFLLAGTVLAVQGQPLYVGLSLVGIVLLVGGLSGAHLNPAITVGAWITRGIGALRGLGYIIFQVLGALTAFWALSAFLRGVDSDAFFGSSPELFQAGEVAEGKEWYILFSEMLGTAILAFGVATALRAKAERLAGAFSVGLALLVALVIAGSVTGYFLTAANTGLTFINPAIASAAQALSWEAWPLSIYVLAPIIGGGAGFLIQDYLAKNNR